MIPVPPPGPACLGQFVLPASCQSVPLLPWACQGPYARAASSLALCQRGPYVRCTVLLSLSSRWKRSLCASTLKQVYAGISARTLRVCVCISAMLPLLTLVEPSRCVGCMRRTNGGSRTGWNVNSEHDRTAGESHCGILGDDLA